MLRLLAKYFMQCVHSRMSRMLDAFVHMTRVSNVPELLHYSLPKYIACEIIFNISTKISFGGKRAASKVLNALFDIVVDDDTRTKHKLCFCFEKFSSIVGVGIVSWINDVTLISTPSPSPFYHPFQLPISAFYQYSRLLFAISFI